MDNTITNKNLAELVKEIMGKFNEARELWISRYGNDNGFNEWFTRQVISSTN